MSRGHPGCPLGVMLVGTSNERRNASRGKRAPGGQGVLVAPRHEGGEREERMQDCNAPPPQESGGRPRVPARSCPLPSGDQQLASNDTPRPHGTPNTANPMHCKPNALQTQCTANPMHCKPNALQTQCTANPMHCKPNALQTQCTANPMHCKPNALQTQCTANPMHCKPNALQTQCTANPMHPQPNADGLKPTTCSSKATAARTSIAVLSKWWPQGEQQFPERCHRPSCSMRNV